MEEFKKTNQQITGGVDTPWGKATSYPFKDRSRKEHIEAGLGTLEEKEPRESLRFKYYSLLNKPREMEINGKDQGKLAIPTAINLDGVTFIIIMATPLLNVGISSTT